MDGVVLGAAVVLGMAALVSWPAFDERAIAFLSQASPILRANFWVVAFTRLGKAWLQIWLLLVWFVISRRRHDILAGLLALVIVGATVNPMKLVLSRPRPYVTLRAETTGQPDREITHRVSFPSADTATACGVVTAVLPVVGWPVRLVLLGCCAGIGALRITSLAHYPSDVLAGAAIGCLAGWLAIRLVNRWRRSDRALPHEKWLVLGGLIGTPVAVGVFNGLSELSLFLKTYGVLAFCVVLAARGIGTYKKTEPPAAVPRCDGSAARPPVRTRPAPGDGRPGSLTAARRIAQDAARES